MLTERLQAGPWFAFAEVDIEIPDPLWLKFKEIPPFLFTKQTLDEPIPQPMKDYLQRTGGERGDGKKLIEALSAQKLLLYSSNIT